MRRNSITVHLMDKGNFNRLQDLIDKHLTDDECQEVFILVANLLPKADDFLLRMKYKVDSLVRDDKTLCSLFSWVEKKANLVKTLYRLEAVRALYFSLHIAYAHTGALAFDRAYALTLTIDRALSLAFKLDCALARDFILMLDRNFTSTFNVIFDPTITFIFDRVFALVDNFNIARKLAVRKVEIELPQLLELKRVIIKSEYIEYTFKLEQPQIKILHTYFTVNKLLMECLKSESCVSEITRQKILNELLLVKK